eukprot:5002788-Alexandrium_andersonii.AAC.1
MSASLVGSEMCIRDSPEREGKKLEKARFKHCVRCCRRLPWEGPPGRGGCLLYTSDAADDM